MRGLPGERFVTHGAFDALIDAADIVLRRGDRLILRDINLRINPGEILTIVGPNGSGKTSLLRILTGADQPTHGTIRRQPDLKIGYSPQRLHIDATLPLTVDGFLALAARSDRQERRDMLRRTGVDKLAQQSVTALSGGELQRVLLARALLRQPDLLVLDEPTQGLDQLGEAELYRLIGEIRNETGAAVLMVSHDLHVVMSASDRVLCLNGHICCQGKPVIVATHPNYQALFGGGTTDTLALYRHRHDHTHDRVGSGLEVENVGD